MRMHRPGSTTFRLAAALAALGLSLATVAFADPFALIASVKGKVEVVNAKGETARASFGRGLERGDKVVVGAGASATVYFSDGNVIELAEKSSVTVGGKVAAKSRTGGADIPGGVYAQVSKVVTGGSRQSGLVGMSQMRGAEQRAPLILSPRNSDLLEDRPVLQWRPIEGATRYKVTVSGDDGALWSRDVKAGPLAWPADAAPLTRDADYLWLLEAFSDKGLLAREESVFHVVSANAAGVVRDDVDRIRESAGGDDSAASAFLAGSYLLGKGLYHDAAGQFETLCRISPEAAAPHEALGNAYRAMGLMDQAAAEFQKALELSRMP